MKWLFVLLLLGNLLFYGYTRLETPPAPVDWRSRELNADKLRQVAFEPAKPVETAAPAEVETAPASEPAAAEAAKPAETSVASTPTPELSCFAWRGILPADLPNARKKLASLQLGGEVKLESNEADGPQRFWVYIPPRTNLEDAQKKGEELKGLGVTDFFVVNDGTRWNRAVSLGLFSSREAAQRRLEALKQQGVRSAQISERGEGESKTLLLRQVPKSARLALGRAAMNFRGSTVSETGC